MKLIEEIREILKDYENNLYIVGGTLRDEIIGEKINDYDFVTLDNADKISKLVADKIGGAYIPYGAEKGTYRVVFKGYIMDFTNMKGKDIYEDLLHRDFSFNSMAMRLIDYFDTRYLIDPYGGLNDIKNKTVRNVADFVFDEDPLRMLRAIRFASIYGYDIDENTKKLIKEKAVLIKSVSSERIMHEIYIILKSKNAYKYIKLMDELTLFDSIFPEVANMKDIGKCYYHVLDAWNHSIKTVEEYEEIINRMDFPINATNIINEYLKKELSYGNYIKDILKLACLFHDIGKPNSIYIDINNHMHFYNHDIKGERVMSGIVKRMKMGKKESVLVKKIILSHMRPLSLYVNGMTNKSLFKFFSDLKDDAIGCLLISEADVIATRKSANRYKEAEQYRIFILKVLLKYIDYKKTETPYLTPLDIIINFDLKDNKLLKQILYELRKNQFYGEIKNKEDAIKFVEERINIERI